ncbi:MAG: efflux RND transporter permease subunit [Bacteroidota bacterium]
MKNLFHSYKHPITLLLVIIIVCGTFFYSKMQVSLFPEITFPKIKIIADDGEQPVDKMMVSVTRPLENAIKQVPDVKLIRSTTSRGSCEISAFLNWHSDINQSLQMLDIRLNEIKNQLPPTAQIQVQKMNPAILPVMGFALESDTKTPIELNLIANYIIKPYISQVEGVAQVGIVGGKTKEFRIVLKPQNMSANGITPDMITTAFNQTNFIKSNGYLADYRRLYLTVTNSGIYNQNDLENIIIKNNKRIIRLKDIATIEIKEKIEYTRVNANGRQALLITVLKQPDANIVELSKNLNEKLDGLKKILPKGVKLSSYYNQADFVNDSMHSVGDSLWFGLFLAIIVAILFLRSLKASITILITIPLTLLLSIIILYSIGYTLNIMTVGAIAAAIGLIIDDAVVVIEQIHRTHEENPGLRPKLLIGQSVHYLFPSMVGSSISTIVIFIPFILMGGVAGAYFNVLTNTMIITLVCSFFVTWIGLPVIYHHLADSRFFRHRKERIEIIKVTKTQRWVAYFIKKPLISISIIAFLILSIFYIIPKIETGFLPEMDEGSIVLDYTSPPGTSLDETNRILHEVEKIITSIPEYESYSRRTGAQMGFFITEPNYGDFLIQLKKDRKRSTEEVIDDIRKKVEASQPALRIDFGQVINDMLGDLMHSVQPIEIKIYGDNQEKLHAIAKQVAEKVSKVEGTADIFNGITIAGPSIEIKPDERKLYQFGITPANLQYQMQTQLEGNVIGSIPEREQYTDIRMVYPNHGLTNAEDLKKQFIFMPDGKLKPASSFATVEIKQGAAEMVRENLQSVAIVTGRLNNRDLGSTMNDIQATVKAIPLPNGYYISYGGAYADQKSSFNELLLILISSSLLIFALMLFLFKDIKAATSIFIIAILGVAGSLIALYLTHTPLNVGSYTGLIMIVGILGENAIFTTQQFFTKLETESVDDALIYAISTRLRPKLMTALGAIIALMPLALGIGTGAQMHQPLAIAVIGGFLFGLPLLLIVFPSILRIAFKNHKAKQLEEEN